MTFSTNCFVQKIHKWDNQHSPCFGFQQAPRESVLKVERLWFRCFGFKVQGFGVQGFRGFRGLVVGFRVQGGGGKFR